MCGSPNTNSKICFPNFFFCRAWFHISILFNIFFIFKTKTIKFSSSIGKKVNRVAYYTLGPVAVYWLAEYLKLIVEFIDRYYFEVLHIYSSSACVNLRFWSTEKNICPRFSEIHTSLFQKPAGKSLQEVYVNNYLLIFKLGTC